jgi:hypothetical protein
MEAVNVDSAPAQIARRGTVAQLTGFREIDRVVGKSHDPDAIAAWQQVAEMFRQQEGFNADFETRIKALEDKVRQLRS